MYVIHLCIHIIIVVMFDMLMWTIVAGVTWSVSHWSQIKSCVQGPPRGGC